MRFKIGDRVKIVGLRDSQHLNGTVTIVTAVSPKRCTVTGLEYEGFSDTAYYEVDTPDEIYGGNCCVHERNLAPYDDGNEKVSWSTCLWKPKEFSRV